MTFLFTDISNSDLKARKSRAQKVSEARRVGVPRNIAS